MIVVIIAGGSGTRLWPLSRPDYPKHLLRVNDDELSLLQLTYKRAKRLTDKVYIATEAGHLQHVEEQLAELESDKFIVEPARRGTANCIIAALAYVGQRHEADEPIAFIHADHYIRDVKGFVYSFRQAEREAKKHDRIVLVGIEPDNPATGFGYIEKGDLHSDQSFIFDVRSFKEKPDYRTALTYYRSGNYLWNGGFFVATLTAFLVNVKQYAPELADNYQKLLNAGKKQKQTYLSFETEAIDYALIEKVPDLLVVQASFDWLDLGSFNDLAKAVSGDELGNHLHGDGIAINDVKNSYVHNEEGKPIAIIGLDNVVVVNTPEGLLVARKDLSQRVGEVSKQLAEDN